MVGLLFPGMNNFGGDVWYVDNWSLRLDLKIVGMTIKKVLKREGIRTEGEATAAEFNPQITQINAN
jgi:sugar transferase EpsL